MGIVSHVVNAYMIFQVYTSANDEFTRIAALILAKIWLTGTLTSVKRLANGSAHYAIPEDRKFASAKAQKKLKEKYPDGKIPRKAVGEKMMSLHHDDIYNVIPFLAIVYLTKSFAAPATLAELMKYFLY